MLSITSYGCLLCVIWSHQGNFITPPPGLGYSYSVLVLEYWISGTRIREFESRSNCTCTRTRGQVLRYSYEYWHEYWYSMVHLRCKGDYPTPGYENQWIWAVVSKGVDTTGPNLHIGYNTLICITVPRERTGSWHSCHIWRL